MEIIKTNEEIIHNRKQEITEDNPLEVETIYFANFLILLFCSDFSTRFHLIFLIIDPSYLIPKR